LPPTHCCPLAQAAPPPHLHAPAVQLSAPTPHETQAAPPVPHAPSVLARQVLEKQQPLGHEVASQVQAPPTQCWPDGQGAAAPHAQVPPAVQVSEPTPQLVQAPPPVPHAPGTPTLQIAPLQQPFAHEVALHTHAPPTHCWPLAQAAPVPHLHAPPEQRFARLGSQATHAPPPVPQALAWPMLQTLPLQQPLAHEVGLHTHAPATHCWPATHAGPPPQLQAPLVQPSASRMLQLKQAPPGVPQVEAESVMQLPLSQQPLGQLVRSQVHLPPTHSWPDAHVAQAAPPEPHAPLALPARQVVPLQQPLHEVALHTHLPRTHCWPAAHGPPVVPHTQLPPVQLRPLAHDGPLPQAQLPEAEQRSAPPLIAQLMQKPPPEPHSVSCCTSQVKLPGVPKQQPFGQLVALH
jgi:hypothetical protein